MNAGMATLINNYYRKRTDRDPYIPEVSPASRLLRRAEAVPA